MILKNVLHTSEKTATAILYFVNFCAIMHQLKYIAKTSKQDYREIIGLTGFMTNHFDFWV